VHVVVAVDRIRLDERVGRWRPVRRVLEELGLILLDGRSLRFHPGSAYGRRPWRPHWRTEPCGLASTLAREDQSSDSTAGSRRSPRDASGVSSVRKVPRYLDLLQRAVEARDRAAGLHTDARRIAALAQLLREANAGHVLLRRCAWCDRFEIGSEWLALDAVGSGEQHLTSSLRDQATHGICPECFDRVQAAAERTRKHHTP
jgi:hypothetical protein